MKTVQNNAHHNNYGEAFHPRRLPRSCSFRFLFGVCRYTNFFAHFPDFSMNNPIAHLKISKDAQITNSGMMGRSVSRERINPTGTLMPHTKAESNRKVMKVCPPDRKVK